MFKKIFLLALVFLGALSLYAQEEKIPWNQNITMLVVPREPLAIQVAQDISRRYPVLLVCYQITPDEPVLHAWNSESWVGITEADYANGTFFTNCPRHAIIVETEGRPAPDMLIPDGIWCESGNRITSADPRVMIHLLGRYFNFPYRYWMQFSKRYNYALEQINPALINVMWWHYRADEAVAAFKARDFDRDMDQWLSLDINLPEPIEPVVIEADPEIIPPADPPAEEMMTDQPVDMLPEEPVDMLPEEPVDMLPEEPAMKAETTQMKTAPAEPVEKKVEEILEELSGTAPEGGVNPFSTNDIPAAELIMPLTK